MLKDTTVFILGGTGSIGSAVAEAFRAEGAKVCCHGLHSGNYQADLRDSRQVNNLVDKVLSDFGRVDILVNSVSAPAKIEGFEKKEWHDFLEHFNVQLKAGVEITKLLLPQMKERREGRIINVITSYVVGNPPTSLSDYIAAKYALLGLTKALAQELGRYNIKVNAVSPTFIKNRFTEGVPEKMADILISQAPLRRLVTSEDVAQAVVFLASDKAANITGSNLVI